MVTKMLSVHQLYGEVDNLTFFVHPVYHRKFDFLSDEKLLGSAQQIAARIEKSDYRNVVVSETGARPLAYVCERLLEQGGTKVQWTYMKFPREPTGNIHPLMRFYLTEEGRKDQNEWQKKMARVLEGTRIADTLAKPFLFFDEYIDSGTTLQNSHRYFNCFTGDIDFRTLSYYTNIGASSEFERIFFSEFDQDSQLQCYSRGAYPFENRIDLIGYYYFINDDAYLRRSLEEVVQMFKEQKQVDPANLLQNLNAVIRERDLLEIVKEQAKIPAVAQFLDESQIFKYYISALEQATEGKGPSGEFLWQLFE